MLKFLVKLFVAFVFLLPLFLFAPKGPGPQPAYAVDNCVLKITSSTPKIGQPVTTKMTSVNGFYQYRVELFWRDPLGSPAVRVAYKDFDQLGATEFNFTWAGSNFTAPGTYTFRGSRIVSVANNTTDVCKENPPPFTLSGSFVPACGDGEDNDLDGKIDYAYNPAIHPDLSLIPITAYGDPGCSSWDDNDESNFNPPLKPACSDGKDNDADGKIDHPADPGCTSEQDTSEEDFPQPPPSAAACKDGNDNDGDGKIDFAYDSKIHPDLSLIPITAYGDPGCSSWDDNNETDPGVPGENPCADFDSDGDIECKTALGTIDANIAKFAQKILNIGIGLAGGIALILMVIGAVRVLTSSGDQQKLNAGREIIIAALAGLLFLIFSVIILKFVTTGLGFNWFIG